MKRLVIQFRTSFVRLITIICLLSLLLTYIIRSFGVSYQYKVMDKPADFILRNLSGVNILPPYFTRIENLCPIVTSKALNPLFSTVLTNLTRVDNDELNFSDKSKCSAFKQIEHDEPAISDEELDFPLAFSFNIHKDVTQFARLLRAVYRKHNAYCIHVDAKATMQYRRTVQDLANCFGPNVHVIPAAQSVSIRWGDLGTLRAWFECAKFLLYRSSVRWKYLLNGSGQEFPLRTNRELVKALKAINGSNIVESDYPNTGKHRAPVRQPSFNLTWFKSSIYTALRKDMVQFALTNKYATEIWRLLRTEQHQVKLQDEIFFTTLNYNPHFNAPGGCPEVHRPNDNDARSVFVGRYADWNPGRCLSKRSQRGVCIMGIGNVPDLTSRPEFFVNKFIYDFQPLAYDCLEWWLFQKIQYERDFGHTVFEFDTSFYANLYCTRNHL